MQIRGLSPEQAGTGRAGRAPRGREAEDAGSRKPPADLVEVQRHLARSFGKKQVDLACEYLDSVVRPQASGLSWEAEKDRFVGLMALMGDATMARRARELLLRESGSESLDQRYQLFEGLVGFEKQLGELPLDPRSDRLPEHRIEPPVRAVWDYRGALENRPSGQSLTEAVETIRTVHRHVAPREGWRASHETGMFLQDGCARGIFPGRNREEAFRDFLRTWLMTQSLDRCREVLLHAPEESPVPSVEKKPEEVVIGGVRVPVKHKVMKMPPRRRPSPGRDRGLG